MTRFNFLVLFLALLITSASASYQAKFDEDTGENCDTKVDNCYSDDETFHECSATCRRHMQANLVKRTEFYGKSTDPDSFYDLEANAKKEHSTLSFERFEGYIVVLAVIPLIPGVAKFYFDLLDHLHEIYPITVEVVVLPVSQFPKPMGPGDSKFSRNVDSKITELWGWIPSETNPIIKFLGEGASMNNEDFKVDAVTVFTISADALYVQASIFPSLSDLQKVLKGGQRSSEF
mmetsp:Transcript_30660/g.45383  ORF Transcript_30660/g.45383 Transcript_30660/m.45383 type:complete len:233 (+) Transcript_30660:202-900(+)|eukprot:CAMPEP_0195527614 /NCGR_PEP_ID=MMETSP0794_2-20130614/29430_1 /TAXON_ID=515487 /ORGANISM="Stephanopyxis turris, Strain CCMP 815" /LENGTH=232 /DNA_ID=CAMNT_0040658573 /DNA_START=201 /DNA_END=899 /DNA_ORIENTATION=+